MARDPALQLGWEMGPGVLTRPCCLLHIDVQISATSSGPGGLFSSGGEWLVQIPVAVPVLTLALYV